MAPLPLEETLRAMAAAAQAGDWQGAAAMADNAVRSGAAHPSLYNTRAVWAEMQERHQDALDDYLRALPYAPDHPLLLSAIGLSLVRVNRAEDGLGYLERAISQVPQEASTYFYAGWAHGALGNKDEARAAYHQALERDPNHAQALAALAMMEIGESKADLAEPYAQRAFAATPDDEWAILAMASVEIARGDFAAAETRLRAMLSDGTRQRQAQAHAQSLLGSALEGQDRTRDAFAAFTAKGQILHDLHARRLAGSRTNDRLRAQTAKLKTMDSGRWTRTPLNPDSETPHLHVFLLSFFRSDTQLLERVLLSDPSALLLQERDTLGSSVAQFLNDAEGLERLANAPATVLEQARGAYWQRVRNDGIAPHGRIVIDRQPLAALYLPLIWRLFPDAKILLALHDPRDAVLNGFRHRFEVNATTIDLLRLEDIAQHYADTMEWAQLCRDIFALDLHEFRYEDMIDNVETHARTIRNFLGISGHGAVQDFNTAAPQDTIVSTGAARLDHNGIGQWRRYAGEMAPVLPVLAPWIARFGYPQD